MKHLKKLASALLALIMVMALAVPAFAGSAGGSITIDNATVDATYTVYKIFDATYSGEHAAYTINSVKDNGDANPWYALVTSEEGQKLFTLEQVGDSTVYNVKINEGMSAESMEAWIGGLTLPEPTDSKEAETTTVEFTGLGQGYFLVKSTVNNGALITLTNAKPDVTIQDKNQEPSGFNKEVDGLIKMTDKDGKEVNSIEIGQVMTFTLTYNTTNYAQGKKILEYEIKDNMPEGMILTEDPIVVKVGDTELAEEAYTLVQETNNNASNFTVTIPWTSGEDKDFLYASPNQITITYKAKLTENAKVDGTGNENTASVSYTVDTDTPGSDPDPKKEESSKTVYTYALAVKKVDKDSKQPLAGAEFTLTNSKGEAVKLTQGDDGYYVVDPDGTITTVTSPEDGLIVIKGVSGDTYQLTEVKAPDGYNKLTGPQSVTPTLIGTEKTSVVRYLDADGNVIPEMGSTTTETTVLVEIADLAATDVIVVNSTGTELPETGGIGTTIFYIVGGVLVVAAVVLLITKRRAGVDDE